MDSEQFIQIQSYMKRCMLDPSSNVLVYSNAFHFLQIAYSSININLWDEYSLFICITIGASKICNFPHQQFYYTQSSSNQSYKWTNERLYNFIHQKCYNIIANSWIQTECYDLKIENFIENKMFRIVATSHVSWFYIGRGRGQLPSIRRSWELVCARIHYTFVWWTSAIPKGWPVMFTIKWMNIYVRFCVQ